MTFSTASSAFDTSRSVIICFFFARCRSHLPTGAFGTGQYGFENRTATSPFAGWIRVKAERTPVQTATDTDYEAGVPGRASSACLAAFSTSLNGVRIENLGSP